jgi:hypothetical protein
MYDIDIRLALDASLKASHSREPDTIIRHELGLCEGKRRIDVVMVNGELNGYEIKSDEDNLNRLLGQAATYGQVLDRAVLVTTERHMEHARDMLPLWWGIVLAHPYRKGISFESVREPLFNEEQVPFSLAQLLWREEALDELRVRGKSQGLSKKARYYVWETLASVVSLNELRSVVRARLKVRPDWPGGQLRAPYDGRLPTPAIA